MRVGACFEVVDLSERSTTSTRQRAHLSRHPIRPTLEADGQGGQRARRALRRLVVLLLLLSSPIGGSSELDPETAQLTSSNPIPGQCSDPARVVAPPQWIRSAVRPG